MSFVKISAVSKSFGTSKVVKNIDLDIARGEFVSLLGPSGCGKTTVLRMVAGFETTTSGKIIIDGEDVTALGPAQRKVGMVFQAYALFPNMSVSHNVAFGLKIAGTPGAAIKSRVAEMLELVKLPHLADRYPFQLSGGQQQRVALARALAVKPRVLLLDEPLSALDAKIRVSLREEIRAVQRQLGITTIFVTHDQEEALSISDRVVVMDEGRIEQAGTPFDIYNFPRTRFVASFIGTLTLLPAIVLDPAAGTLLVDGQTIRAARGLDRAKAGEACTLALRPEAVKLGNGTAPGNVMQGKIEEVSFLGSIVRIRVRTGSQMVSLDTFNQTNTAPPAIGSDAAIAFSADDLVVLDQA